LRQRPPRPEPAPVCRSRVFYALVVSSPVPTGKVDDTLNMGFTGESATLDAALSFLGLEH